MRNLLPWFLAGCFAVVLFVQSWRLESIRVAIAANPKAQIALAAAGFDVKSMLGGKSIVAATANEMKGSRKLARAAAGEDADNTLASSGTAGNKDEGNANMAGGNAQLSPLASEVTRKQLTKRSTAWRTGNGDQSLVPLRPQAVSDTPSPAAVQAWYTQAADAFNMGDYDKAVSLLGQAIEANPKYGPAYDMMASVCRNLGLLPEQRSFYEQWAAGDPNNPAPHARLAQFYTQQGMPDKASAEARLYEQTPGFGARPDSYLQAANLYRSVGEFGEAERVLRSWTSSSPELAAPHWSLAELYRTSGKPAEAVAEYMNVLALTPGNADAYTRVADYYALQKRYGEAIAMQQQAVELRAGDMQQRIRLADLYQKGGSIAQALAVYQDVVQRALPTSYEYKSALTNIRKLQTPLPAK